jgi:spore coat protein A, manganese oxidase
MVQFAVGNVDDNDPIHADPAGGDDQDEQPMSYGPSYPAGT